MLKKKNESLTVALARSLAAVGRLPRSIILSNAATVDSRRAAADIPRAFASYAESKLDALSVGIGALIQAQAGTIIELAARHRVRAAYPSREFVDAGACPLQNAASAQERIGAKLGPINPSSYDQAARQRL